MVFRPGYDALYVWGIRHTAEAAAAPLDSEMQIVWNVIEQSLSHTNTYSNKKAPQSRNLTIIHELDLVVLTHPIILYQSISGHGAQGAQLYFQKHLKSRMVRPIIWFYNASGSVKNDYTMVIKRYSEIIADTKIIFDVRTRLNTKSIVETIRQEQQQQLLRVYPDQERLDNLNHLLECIQQEI